MSGQIIATALGLFVGLSLGALGGGGSTLAVPILVFVAGMNAQDATATSLLVVGIAAAIGVLGHYRNGNVRFGAGASFGAAGIVGSRAGTLLNRSLDEELLLLAFSGLILFVAVRMLRSASHPNTLEEASDKMVLNESDSHTKQVLTRTRPRQSLSASALAKLAGAATAVGLLTGLFGVGGGFAVVPALTLLLGFKTKEAIGTSLVVIAINAAIALSMRSGELNIDWELVLPFLVTVIGGVVIGSRVASSLDADRLTKSFSIMLGLVAAYTAFSTLYT